MDWLFDLISQKLEQFTYFGTFFFLYLCGVAIPIPEEPILIAAGYIAYKGYGNVWLLIAAAMAGIMLGDLSISSIGNRWGPKIVKLPGFRRLLTEERIAKGAKFYAEHGAKAVYFGRFVAGVRYVAFFTAGKFGVPLSTFFFLDLLAALITVPISILAGYWFGANLEEAISFAKRSHRIVIGILVGLVAVVILDKYTRRRRRAAHPVPPHPLVQPVRPEHESEQEASHVEG